MMARHSHPSMNQSPTERRWSLLLPSWATPPALLPHPQPKLPIVARRRSGTSRAARPRRPASGLTAVLSDPIATRPSSAPLQVTPPHPAMRLRVRIRQRVLDREIAAGLPSDFDAARAIRAQQLTSTAERCRVAACLASILEVADQRHADPSAPLNLNHAEVLAARHELLALIDALRGEGAVGARGVALARQLIQSSGSPLSRARANHTVQQAVSMAIAAL